MAGLFYVSQNIISGPKLPSRLEARHVPRRNAGEAVNWLLENKFPWRDHPIPVGITLDQDSSQQITALALSMTETSISITIDPSSVRELNMIMHDSPFTSLMSGKGRFGSKNAAALYGREYEEEYKNTFILVGFDFARTAVLIRKYVGIDVKGIDLGTLISPSAPWSPGRMVCARVNQNANQWTVNKCWDERQDKEAFFMRAWVSHCIADRCQSELVTAVPADTSKLSFKELDVVQNMVAETFWLDQLRPREVVSDFESAKRRDDGRIDLMNERFKTRVRRSERQAVVLTTTNGREHTTRARGVVGKTTTLSGISLSGQIQSVRVVGRQDPTNSERLADVLLLSVLQGKKTFHESPFIRLFWFPTWKKFRPPEDSALLLPGTVEAVLNSARLNESQERVARMAESKERVVVVHGPPGTGKTTTIAAISRIWDMNHCPVWIIAHSNVAVKNIAVALEKRGVDFKIIVSKEFYEEWHEHLYLTIRHKLIRSDELPESVRETERVIGESCIMLSTLGMLSNPALEQRGLFQLVPVERLIVDEASQIRIFEFLHLFEMFPLEKIFFFGDPHQLPPFNHDTVKGMQTVFDLEHLNTKERSFMLDVQYRMPVALGQFISHFVYQNKLQSVHDIKSSDCVLFVNVPGVAEGAETKMVTSWVNHGEIRSVVQLVRTYYQSKEFAVVTPYDAQRGMIERALKAEGLPWENGVFNIDSFQGNERDYIIISLVRTDKPGFLESLNRLNVMLTRCKKGMVVVTNRDFLLTKGSNILVARFAAYWRTTHGPAGTWAESQDILRGSVDVPGVAAPHPSGRVLVNYESSAHSHGGSTWATTASLRPGYIPERYRGANGFDTSRLFMKSKPKPVTVVEPTVTPSLWSPSVDPWSEEEVDDFYAYQDYYFSPVPSPSNFLRMESPYPTTPVYPPIDPTSYSQFPTLSPTTSTYGQRVQPQPQLHSHSLARPRNAWNRVQSTRAPTQAPPAPRAIPQPSTGNGMPGPTWTFVRSGVPANSRTVPVANPSYPTHNSNDRPANVPSSPVRGTTGRNTAAPTLNTAASMLDGGWTRVERRKGYGRKKNFNAAPGPTASSASKQATKKKRGYRYWASLD